MADQLLTDQISEYVTRESITEIPPVVRTHAKYCVLDSIGVTIGGTRLHQGSMMKEFWEDQGGTPHATVVLSGQKYPVMTATYVNGYLANLLDYDDTYSKRAIGHPGGTIVPAALAVSERENLDGATLLEGVITGYEVSTAIGDAIAPSPDRARDVVGINTWQIFGTAATVAHLLELSESSVADALSIAGINASVPSVRKVGIQEDDVHWMKNNFGWTAMGGVNAALLAERGFKGNHSMFDGTRGFWRMAASDRFEPTEIGDLSESYRTLDVSFKPYSSCRWSHAALDCIGDLKDEIDGTDLERIESIRVETFYEATKLDSYPRSVFDAQFSLPYVVAVYLLGYPPGFDWLTRERIECETVRDLASTVELIEDEALTERYESRGQMSTRVYIELDDGWEYTASTSHAKGSPENPIDHGELERKFKQLTAPILGEEQSRELKQCVLTIEEKNSVRELCSLLR